MANDTNDLEKITVVTPLRVETAALSKAAKALALPAEEDRQPDLQYLTAIFVSSGMNKNGAVFLGSELCKASKTIAHKAVDIEHDERAIIGQITNSVYMDHAGKLIDPCSFVGDKVKAADMMDMDVAISAIIHKARFPEIADQILNGEWMVSMEAYYRDYDVKVGDLIIPRDQASQLGYDKLVGSVVRVKDGKKELGFHLVGRVLRDITFCGVGIVKSPANERSVILESAALKEFVDCNKENASVLDLSEIAEVEKAPPIKTVPSLDGVADQKKLSLEEIIEEALAAIKEELERRLGAVELSHKSEKPANKVESNPPDEFTDLADWKDLLEPLVKKELLPGYESIKRSIENNASALLRLQALIDEAKTKN